MHFLFDLGLVFCFYIPLILLVNASPKFAPLRASTCVSYIYHVRISCFLTLFRGMSVSGALGTCSGCNVLISTCLLVSNVPWCHVLCSPWNITSEVSHFG